MPSSTRSRNEPSPDAIDLGGVARTVARKLPVVALIALLAGGATAGVLSSMAPKYLSQAQLEVRGLGPAETGGRPDKEAVGTHVRALMSTELALAMSTALHLTQLPEFNSALQPGDMFGRTLRTLGLGGPKGNETDEDRLMQAYFQLVRAYQVRDTRSIIVDCTSSNAKFSAECANTLAGLYRDSLRGRASGENADLRTKLIPQVDRLTREAAEADAQVTAFRGKANLFQGGTQSVQLKDQQLGELTAELTRVSAARSDAEARANAARDMATRGLAAANPDVQKSTLIPRMEDQRVSLERQIAELSATLLRGHPRMKQLTSELASLQAQIRAEILKVVDSLGNDARIAAGREDGIRRRIDEMKRTLVSSAPDSAKLSQLENDAKAKRAELERLQNQYEKAASTAGAGTSVVEIEIVSRAYPSNEKVFPKIGSMSAMAAFATLVLGLALAMTRELIRGARPVALPQRTIGEPDFAKGLAAATPFATSPIATRVNAAPLQTIAAAAASLSALSSGTRGFRVILAPQAPIANSEREALAIARDLAGNGYNALLLAWDGAGDALAVAAELNTTPGTAQLLTGTTSLEDAIQRLPGTSLDIITAGAVTPGTSGSIDGDTAAMVLDALDDMYDFILVCGRPDVAGALFTAIQGRFDAGVLTAEKPPAAAQNGTVPFLGFDVADFPVIAVAQASAVGTAAERPGQPPAANRLQTAVRS